MKIIFKRFMAEKPAFFKKVQAFGTSLAGAGTAITFIPNIPEVLNHYASQAIWVGAVIAVIAQLTCKNPEELK